MGFDSIMPHGQRYENVTEFTELTYRLWEGSWDDDAQQWDIEADMAYDPSKIKKIEFDGKFHKLSAAHQTHPLPQHVPVMFQAGSSKAGIAFAGGHAEGVFSGSLIPSHTAKYVQEIRTATKESGRDPKSVKAFPGIHCLLRPLSKKHS
jgi:alkanesulfonate monooxygenase SsuD/methylene tetrahydromethanopterin reductase-like flavin-dependent oxidoreductase (luciferase family)